jgi:predicted aspartyl protease
MTVRAMYPINCVYIAIAAIPFFLSPIVFAQDIFSNSALQVVSSEGLATTQPQVVLELNDALSKSTDDLAIFRAPKLMPNNDFVVSVSPDGHYYVPATINGFSVPLMVDSGADVSLIPASLALKTGISQSIKMPDGQTIDYKKSANIIKIGNSYVNNARILAKDQLEMPRLGSDALNMLDISYVKGVMTIKPIDGVIKSNALLKN